MSNLRKEVIKLATRKPELRNVLLPLLKESSSGPSQEDAEFVASFVTWLRGNDAGPKTRNFHVEMERLLDTMMDFAFGDQSPWILKRRGSRYTIEYSNSKASLSGIL